MTTLAFVRGNARWLSAGYLLTAFSGFGQTFFISLSAGNLRAETGLSHGELGGLYMLATLASALALPAVGKTLDTHPVRRVAGIVVAGLALSCLALASATSVWMIALAFFGLRLSGQGMMTHTAITAAGRWFSARRGRAVSLTLLGLPTAEAVLPILFVGLSGLIGWRGAWIAGAAVLLCVTLPVLMVLLAKDRVPSAREEAEGPAEGRQWTRSEVLRDPVFWLVNGGLTAPAFIGTAVLFHQVYLVDLRGWTLEVFASAFVVMAASVVCVSLVIGPLIDRFSARRLLPVALVPLSAGCMVLASVQAPIAAFVFLGLVGVSNGIIGALVGALWPEVYGSRHLGAIRSVAFALMVFASAAGPGLVGWLIDAGIAFDKQIFVMGAYCVLFCLVLWGAGRHYGGRVQT